MDSSRIKNTFPSTTNTKEVKENNNNNNSIINTTSTTTTKQDSNVSAVQYKSIYTEIQKNFPVELLNEINLLRDQPKAYRETILKYVKDKDEANSTTSVLLLEGKVTYSTEEYNSALELLEKAKIRKLLSNDANLSKICEKIYNAKIKNLKNYNNLDNDVYKHVNSFILEKGTPAGKVSFVIDVENIHPKAIVLNNLATNKSFFNDKHQLIGIYQEKNITLVLLMRYFIPQGMSNDYVSDSCAEIEEQIIDNIIYEEPDVINPNDLIINKEDWSENVSKIEKTIRIAENEDKDVLKTVTYKRLFYNGEVESNVTEEKITDYRVISSYSPKKIRNEKSESTKPEKFETIDSKITGNTVTNSTNPNNNTVNSIANKKGTPKSTNSAVSKEKLGKVNSNPKLSKKSNKDLVKEVPKDTNSKKATTKKK